MAFGGYDTQRFVDEIDDNFKCPVCLFVVKTPTVLPCGHLFCRSCVVHWFKHQGSFQISHFILRSFSCPVCRYELTFPQARRLQAASHPFRNLLGKLHLKCDFNECNEIVSLASINDHELNCEHKPLSYLNKEANDSVDLDDMDEIINISSDDSLLSSATNTTSVSSSTGDSVDSSDEELLQLIALRFLLEENDSDTDDSDDLVTDTDSDDEEENEQEQEDQQLVIVIRVQHHSTVFQTANL